MIDPAEAVANLSDQLLVVTGERPDGPAGLVVVELLDGSAELAVDTAEPDTVLSLALARPLDDPAHRLARLILGPVIADALLPWLDRAGGPGSGSGPRGPSPVGQTSVRLGDRDTDRHSDSEPSAQRVRPGAFGPGPLLGRLALGLAELTRPDLTDLEVAASLVEMGTLAGDLGPGLDPSPSGLALATAGIERWELLGPDDWETNPVVLEVVGIRQARWAKSLHQLDPTLADRLRRLRTARFNRMDAAARSGRARGAVSGPLPPAAAAAGPLDLVTYRNEMVAAAEQAAPPTLEVLFDPDVDGWLISADHDGHHLVVHLGGLGDRPCWLRVHRRGTPLRLLALAPVEPGNRRWRQAVALIGPEVGSDDLIVDVTADPTQPWQSDSTRRVRRASRLGVEAARLSRQQVAAGAARPRRQNPVAAAWMECSQAWDEAGDQQRAARASQHSLDPPVPSWARRDPLLTDLT